MATKQVFEDIHKELDILRRALKVTKREFAPIAALAREFLAPRDCEQHGQLCRHCLDACISNFIEVAAALSVWEAAERRGVHNTVQLLKRFLRYLEADVRGIPSRHHDSEAEVWLRKQLATLNPEPERS